jgi:murein DD-endopeptidase MepM/ murein hydrolase activator NlpD
MLAGLVLGAICLVAPVNGPIVGEYAPVGSYAGHWGVDYAVRAGTDVMAPVDGRVTFAGSVAGMRSVTIEPVPGFKVSVSYLSAITVRTGETVRRGQVVGRAGSPHGSDGVHLSTRIDGSYVDPESQLGCRDTDISRALRLVPPPGPYPRSRAHRHPRWELRPDTYRPPPRRGNGDGSSRPRPGGVHARRRPVAEGT